MDITQEALRLIEAGDREGLARLAGTLDGNTLGAEAKARMTRLAARKGRAEILRDLFERLHLHDTAEDGEGRGVLHEAAASGDPETIRFCLDVLGLDPLAGDARGRTPLDEAAEAERPEGLRFLEERLGFTLRDCYRNPVIRGFHPDPSVVRVGEDYYLVNSSFMLFPGLPVFHSRDLVHWELIGHAVEDLAASGLAGLPGGFGYWAPDISYYHGRFWVVATLRRNTAPYRLQMITSAEDPRGPWSTPRFLPLDGIDPSLFADGDRRYILLNPGAILAEISEEGELISEPEMILYGVSRIKSEGPHLLKKDGWYYLFLAEGGTGDGHMESVARSRNLRGPYEACPWNPILGQKQARPYIQRSGHGKPVSTPDGRWYMVYLCGRKTEGLTMTGRETALDPMEWTADGWPMVNRLKGPSCLQRAPYPTAAAPEGRLSEDWVSPRTDPAEFAEIEAEAFVLRGGADPAGTGPCSLLLRRQEENFFRQEAEVDLSECGEGDAGGLTGYYDERSFFLFTARKEQGRLLIEATEQMGAERRVHPLGTADGERLRLAVEGDGLSRRLLVMEDGEWREKCRLRAEYLCDESLGGGKRFTGALYGMAAIGSGRVRFCRHYSI